mgnify:CR=1 FL=1
MIPIKEKCAHIHVTGNKYYQARFHNQGPLYPIVDLKMCRP